GSARPHEPSHRMVDLREPGEIGEFEIAEADVEFRGLREGSADVARHQPCNRHPCVQAGQMRDGGGNVRSVADIEHIFCTAHGSTFSQLMKVTHRVPIRTELGHPGPLAEQWVIQSPSEPSGRASSNVRGRDRSPSPHSQEWNSRCCGDLADLKTIFDLWLFEFPVGNTNAFRLLTIGWG